MPGPVAPVPCPECGGEMWDNSRDPKKKPKASDYRCKNRSGCNGGIWLKPEERAALRGGAPAPPAQRAPAQGQPAGQVAPPRRPLVLEKAMEAALDSALRLSKKFKDGDIEGADHDITLRIAQSLFIARVDGKGILHVEKAALDERAKKAAELAAKQAQERAEAAQKEAERQAELARQASESQLGTGQGTTNAHDFSDYPADPLQDDDLPF